MSNSPPPHGRPRPVEYLLAFAGYAVAACVLLYPVFTRGTSEIYSPSQALARPMASWVMWILAWDVHALTSSAQLFDANVFHPAPAGLAFGDPLLGVAPLFAPVYLLTGNPVLSYQLTLLATLALCGASMFYLARHWGTGIAASALAGLLYAYCPVRLGMLAELAYVSGQFLPLALIFVDRLTCRARTRDALPLFAFAAWQVLCGTQLAYASLIALTVYTIAATLARGTQWRWRGFALALVAVGGAVGVLALSTAPYRSLVRAGMFTGRTMYEFGALGSSDPWRIYLVPPYLSHLGWAGSGGGLYLGLVAIALAGIGVTVAVRRPVTVRLGAVAAVCYWFSLGPDFLGGALAPYRLALAAVPGFATLGPAPSRFALFMMVSVAGLAGFGFDRLQSLAGRRGAVVTALLSAAVLGLVLIDYRLPFQHFETQRIPFGADQMPLYAALAELPPGPVLELPVDPCAVTEVSAAIDHQLGSILHWKPLLDGYRSHDRAPATYEVVRAMANALPDPRVLRLLRRATGLRYVVVHLNDLPGDWRHRWRAVDEMTRVGFFGHDLLFEVAGDGAGDLVDGLLALPRADRTLSGAAKSKLTEAQRAAGLRFTKLPSRSGVVGNRVRAEVLVENRSAATWPALTPDRGAKVYLSYLWTDAAGALSGGDGRAQPLPLDLAPGESVVVPVCVQVPLVTGELDLAFGLTQGDEWFSELSEKVRVQVID